MRQYIIFLRTQIYPGGISDKHFTKYFKIAMRVYDTSIDAINPVSITILDRLPNGVKLSTKYSLFNT